MNGFTKDVPVILVVSEKPEKKGVLGTLVPIDSYIAVDIGIAAAYITAGDAQLEQSRGLMFPCSDSVLTGLTY